MDDAPRQIPAAEAAYEAIRQRIVSGTLKGGTRLTEQALAQDLGLSRTPVRAAITRLVAEGFIERGDGYSTRVAEFPDEELDQLFEVRRRLECYAAERAARLATAAQIADLDRLAGEMEALTPPQTEADFQRLSSCNAEFHRVLAEASRSPRLLAVLSAAFAVCAVARPSTSSAPVALVRRARPHRSPVDAGRARPPDPACR